MTSATAAFSWRRIGDPTTSSIDCMPCCMAPETGTDSACSRKLRDVPDPFHGGRSDL